MYGRCLVVGVVCFSWNWMFLSLVNSILPPIATCMGSACTGCTGPSQTSYAVCLFMYNVECLLARIYAITPFIQCMVKLALLDGSFAAKKISWIWSIPFWIYLLTTPKRIEILTSCNEVWTCFLLICILKWSIPPSTMRMERILVCILIFWGPFHDLGNSSEKRLFPSIKKIKNKKIITSKFRNVLFFTTISIGTQTMYCIVCSY